MLMTNKTLYISLRFVVSTIIILAEECLFYKIALSQVITKSNSDMWVTFIIGSLVLSVINTAVAYALFKADDVKPDKCILLILSSVFSCICLMLLSFKFDKSLLAEVDYRNETNFFVILIYGLSVTVWTAVISLLFKFIKRKTQ